MKSYSEQHFNLKIILMGAHTSYPLVINHLVSMKSHFPLITIEKFQGLIKELSKYEIYQNSDNEHLPDHIQLADKLNCNQAKMNKDLKDLLSNLINGLNDNPLKIKDIIHTIHIYPYIGPEDMNKDWKKKEWERSISIPVVLPVTPRIGDYIEIPFIRTSNSYSTDDKFYSGYVHDVRHKISGNRQEICILAYPYKSFYYKWEEMKEEYENNKRWLQRLKFEKSAISKS